VVALSKFSPPIDSIDVASVHFYHEHDVINPNPVLINEDLWRELAPYAHLIVRDDLESSSTALSTLFSTLSTAVIGVWISNKNETASSIHHWKARIGRLSSFV